MPGPDHTYRTPPEISDFIEKIADGIPGLTNGERDFLLGMLEDFADEFVRRIPDAIMHSLMAANNIKLEVGPAPKPESGSLSTRSLSTRELTDEHGECIEVWRNGKCVCSVREDKVYLPDDVTPIYAYPE